MFQPLYASLKKIHKTKLSKGIVRSIRSQEPPGRFLVFEKETGYWNDIGDKKAIEKTSQALREGQPHTKEKITMLTSMIPAEIPSTTSGFADLITAQAASLALQNKDKPSSPTAAASATATATTTATATLLPSKPPSNRNPNPLRSSAPPERVLPARGLGRMTGSMVLGRQSSHVSDVSMPTVRRTSASSMSMFSNTPSMKAMFQQISNQNLDLDIADCSSQMGDLDYDGKQMDVQFNDGKAESNNQGFNISKISTYPSSRFRRKSSDLTDDELRQAAKIILSSEEEGGKPSGILDFRKHFRDNRANMSDLTSSLSKMGVSNHDFLFKDSDRSIDTCPSLKSIFKDGRQGPVEVEPVPSMPISSAPIDFSYEFRPKHEDDLGRKETIKTADVPLSGGYNNGAGWKFGEIPEMDSKSVDTLGSGDDELTELTEPAGK